MLNMEVTLKLQQSPYAPGAGFQLLQYDQPLKFTVLCGSRFLTPRTQLRVRGFSWPLDMKSFSTISWANFPKLDKVKLVAIKEVQVILGDVSSL